MTSDILIFLFFIFSDTTTRLSSTSSSRFTILSQTSLTAFCFLSEEMKQPTHLFLQFLLPPLLIFSNFSFHLKIRERRYSHTGLKKSTIFVAGTAGLDNAAGYVKYNASRELSESEILNYIISREEKKDKLLMVF